MKRIMKNSRALPASLAVLPLEFQAGGAPPKEGLPYWTFWLLLCVILLLVAFIFLRD